MTTRFELIAQAFPLHAQRIAEATFEQNNSALRYLLSDPLGPKDTARSILLGAFVFEQTAEGDDYWWALMDGAWQL